MKSWYRAAFVLLAFILQTARTAHAQPERVGSFVIHAATDSATQEDRSAVTIIPLQSAGRGFLQWHCVAGGRVTVAIMLGSVSHEGESRRVAWHFDRDRPDTAFVAGMSGGVVWYLPADDVVPFTLRARTARRLVVRAPVEAGSSSAAEYVFDFAEAGAALDRLPCTRETPVAGRPEPRVLMHGVARGTPQAVSPDTAFQAVPGDEGTYELGAVEVLPRIRNRAEIARMLKAGFPAALRGTGVSGTVVVRFRLERDGRVDPSTVHVRHSTHEAFNEPAIAAARSIVARPAMVNRRPVRAWVQMPLIFAADEPVPAPAPAPPPPVRTAPPDEGTYTLAAVEELPRIRNGAEISRMVQNGYPAALRGSGITGRVTLRFRLLENGRVELPTVQVTESTHEAFDEPAIAAVRRIVMAPAKVNGRPVPVWVDMPLTFAADAAAPAAAAPPAP